MKVWRDDGLAAWDSLLDTEKPTTMGPKPRWIFLERYAGRFFRGLSDGWRQIYALLSRSALFLRPILRVPTVGHLPHVHGDKDYKIQQRTSQFFAAKLLTQSGRTEKR